MQFSDLFKRKKEKGFLSVELITFVFMLFTTVLILIHGDRMPSGGNLLLTRLWVMLTMVTTLYIYTRYPCRMTIFLRYAPLMFMLIAWYPENYDFSSLYPNQDHVFASLEQTLFGSQPSLTFGEAMPQTFWCEAFCLGYYAYYYMMIAMLAFYFFCRYDRMEKASFIYLASFFLFYVVFEFLNVAGPQYYFHAVGVETVQAGQFPELGYYFQDHLDCIELGHQGLFSKLVASAQAMGERPAAAFPSSHVGMSTITLMLAWKARNKWLFGILLPLHLLLCCATVYIKAHYLVDAIAGAVVAVAFYYLTKWLYGWLNNPRRKSALLFHRGR